MTFKLLPFFLALFAISWTSCSLVKETPADITVDVDGSEIVFTLPESANGGVFVLPNQEIPSEVIAKLNDENINEERVKSIKLNDGSIDITTADSPFDFDNVQHVELTITTPGLRTVTLVDNYVPEREGYVLPLEVNDTELLDHLLSASSEFQLTVVCAPVPEDIDLVVRLEFQLTATPL